MKTLIKNCKIVNHDNITESGILIDGGNISAITNEGNADKVIDAKGAYALPGLIDMHVHMRDPGLEYKEDIESASKAASAGGITSLCCMANTKPVIDNAVVVNYVVSKAKTLGMIDVFPYGAVTKGMKGEELTEFSDMLNSGAGGFSDDGKTIMNSEVMRRALEYARQFDTFIASHAIDINLEGGGVMHEGAVSAANGLKGIPSEAEAVITIRDILLAKLTNSRVHICHVSAKEAVDLIRWGKEQGIKVTAEATPHHFTLTDKCCENYDTNCKMSPPLREEEDIEAIINGLKDGTIDCIATDHAPHQADEKFVEFNYAPVGITGLQTLIPLTLNLIRAGRLTWTDFARTASYNPAKILGKNNLGIIAPNMQADITIIDPDDEYVFDEKVNLSKSVNSPFWDKTLKGRAIYTIKNGKIVFSL
ncbi:MAG: dihydroorotase [Deferribacterales bacterium]|nr:dihydroorotase [Deferribacterales bacterium]